MNLKKEIEKNKKIKHFILITILILLSLLTTYSFYREKSKQNMAYEKKSQLISNNMNITAYLDGIPSQEIPEKDSNYIVDSISCNNKAQGYWNYSNWELNLKNLSETNTKCKIYFITQYKESILNGTDPIISDNLIPVTIDKEGIVKKANQTNSWYNYENKIWANAIILEDETKQYQNNEIIPENNIESYFVWIPKYKYKLWDLGMYNGIEELNFSKPHSIDIVFGLNNTDDSNTSCKTPGVSRQTNQCAIGKYMTHPVFTNNSKNGMWVGKFETGYKGAKTTLEAEKNIFDVTKIEIKANTFSWRNINISNAHTTSFNYLRKLDSHMMKNTEWGSVAYLSHSQYGINKNIRYNNNSDYITGFSGVNKPTAGLIFTNESCTIYPDNCNEYGINSNITQPYNTGIGYLASTTGNISGIYDMAGGAQEWMMSVILDKNNVPFSGKDNIYNSGFNGPLSYPGCSDGNPDVKEITNGIDYPNKKYYDSYQYSDSNTNYQNRILGDATGELGPFNLCAFKGNIGNEVNNRLCSSWYQGTAFITEKNGPFIARGTAYNYGIQANIFSFDEEWNGGNNSKKFTFRIILNL